MDEPIDGQGTEDNGGHQIDPDEIVLGALKDKQGQDAGDKTKAPAEPPAPAKPAPSANPAVDIAWRLAERDVKKSCPDLDADDVEILKAAAGGDPIRFVDLAENQQAKRAALKAQRPVDPDTDLKTKVAEEVFGKQGPGGTVERPKEPTAQEKVQEAVKKGDRAGVMKGMADVFNAGNDGKPMFPGVTIS